MTGLDRIANALYQAYMAAQLRYARSWGTLPEPVRVVWREAAQVARDLGMQPPGYEVRPWQERHGINSQAYAVDVNASDVTFISPPRDTQQGQQPRGQRDQADYPENLDQVPF